MPDKIITFKISGLDKIQQRLEEQPKKDANKILRVTLNAGADIVLAAMRTEAPRDSGFLEEHFDKKVSIKKDIAGAAFVGPQGKMDYPFTTGHKGGRYTQKTNRRGKQYLSGRIPVVTVARFHEFGTRHEAANPFMSRSFDASKGTALDKIIEQFRLLLGLS